MKTFLRLWAAVVLAALVSGTGYGLASSTVMPVSLWQQPGQWWGVFGLGTAFGAVFALLILVPLQGLVHRLRLAWWAMLGLGITAWLLAVLALFWAIHGEASFSVFFNVLLALPAGAAAVAVFTACMSPGRPNT